MSRLVLAIDVDGVLTDHREKWVEEYRKYEAEHGHTPWDDSHPWTTQWGYFRDTCQRCFYRVLMDPLVTRSHPFREEAKAVLEELSKTCDLYIVSKRPAQILEATKDWLAWHGVYELFKDVIFTSDKNKTCESIGANFLLDDSVEVLIKMGRSASCTPIKYTMPYNGAANFTNGVAFSVENWKDFGAFIADLQATPDLQSSSKVTGSQVTTSYLLYDRNHTDSDLFLVGILTEINGKAYWANRHGMGAVPELDGFNDDFPTLALGINKISKTMTARPYLGGPVKWGEKCP